MRLSYTREEMSVGCYVYIVRDDVYNSICYVKENVPRSKEFVQLLCQVEPLPVVLDDVKACLSPGKEIVASVIDKLLFRLIKIHMERKNDK